MPFDGQLTLQQQSLTDIVRSLGKEPISLDFLGAYKQEQLRKHAGSLFYRHGHKIPGVMLGSLVISALLMSGVTLLSHNSYVAIAMMSALAMAMASISLMSLMLAGFSVKKPAKWLDRYCYDSEVRQCVHSRLADFVLEVVEEARRQGCNTIITVGELYQERIMLDPYVTVRMGGETVCLGIWDRNRIIRKPADITA